MDKTYYLYAIYKLTDNGRVYMERKLLPQITTRYKGTQASILLGRFKNSKIATEYALKQGYIKKSQYGGYWFKLETMRHFI